MRILKNIDISVILHFCYRCNQEYNLFIWFFCKFYFTALLVVCISLDDNVLYSFIAIYVFIVIFYYIVNLVA